MWSNGKAPTTLSVSCSSRIRESMVLSNRDVAIVVEDRRSSSRDSSSLSSFFWLADVMLSCSGFKKFGEEEIKKGTMIVVRGVHFSSSSNIYMSTSTRPKLTQPIIQHSHLSLFLTQNETRNYH